MRDYTLGLDLGSRAVKAVLFDPAAGRVAAAAVRDSSPDQAADAGNLLAAVLAGAGAGRDDLRRIVVTGYGRVQAGFADETATEIACHALGVAAVRPGVRTVVDIGGQDSKAILLGEDGRVRDFAMNDRCAAGCGRFLEVVARILGTDVDGLSELARAAEAESEISSMCVVFAESEVIGMLARGFPRGAIAAGVVRSIARRVAGLAERVGVRPPVAFTGGVALNEAMAAALGRELRERLVIPPDPRVTGALGAALVAARKAGFEGVLREGAAPAIEIPPLVSAVPAPRLGPGDPSPCGQSPCDPPPCAASACAPASDKEAVHSSYLHRIRGLERFDRMVAEATEYAGEEKALGRAIVSIFCEFTPREVILAAGAVPVCACGGSHRTALTAERDLPAGLCPLIKSSYGFALEKANPLFEMSDLVVAETTCDGKKKMFELLADHKPLFVLELPQKPGDDGGLRRWREEIESLMRRLEELTGNRITEAALREAIRLMNRERRLRRAVARLAGRGLTGREVLGAKSLIAGIPEDLDAYETILAEAARLALEPDVRPRVLMTGVPMVHGAEKVLDILESAGATVVAQESCTGLKPIEEDVAEDGDPLEALARKYFRLPCSCMTPNAGRIDLLDRLIEEFKPDGVVDLVWQSCLTYDVESEVVRRHLEKRHGLPCLKVVTDYSPSDAQQIRLRVESFLGLISARHADLPSDRPTKKIRPGP
jgi:predicted CoA-substrate-specific enzyme activase